MTSIDIPKHRLNGGVIEYLYSYVKGKMLGLWWLLHDGKTEHLNFEKHSRISHYTSFYLRGSQYQMGSFNILGKRTIKYYLFDPLHVNVIAARIGQPPISAFISRLEAICLLVVPRPCCVESLRTVPCTFGEFVEYVVHLSSLGANGSLLLKR